VTGHDAFDPGHIVETLDHHHVEYVLVGGYAAQLGDIDLTFTPAGFPDGYNGLLPGAQPHSIGHVIVQVADLDDVIKSKTAAARPKDLDALPELIDIAQVRHKRTDLEGS
jgi:hypothetical protein